MARLFEPLVKAGGIDRDPRRVLFQKLADAPWIHQIGTQCRLMVHHIGHAETDIFRETEQHVEQSAVRQ